MELLVGDRPERRKSFPFSPAMDIALASAYVEEKSVIEARALGAIHNFQCFKISIFFPNCGWVGQAK